MSGDELKYENPAKGEGKKAAAKEPKKSRPARARKAG
jgi:hypothetical protein